MQNSFCSLPAVAFPFTFFKTKFMRKFLLLLFAAGMVSRADAQFAALCIDNSSNPCDVYVTMHAQDPSSSILDIPCDVYSNQFTVAAGAPAGSVCWPTVWAFQSGPGSVGWAAIPVAISASSTAFNWTDVSFQFNCPAPILAGGCSNSGGTMTDQYNYVGGAGCFMSAGSWSSGLGCRNAQWTDGCGVG